MLTRLFIKNFALLEDLELNLENGLTVITGESGSGKSLVLDAITSVLGGRCNTINIRSGAEKYIIEAQYDITARSDVQDWLEDKGFGQSDELVLKKELNKEGRSRITINGSISPAATLRELGMLIGEIHRQNDQAHLLDKKIQLDMLDDFSGIDQNKTELKNAFFHFRKVKSRLEDISREEHLLNQKKEILE